MKKLETHGKKITQFQQEIFEKNQQIKKLEIEQTKLGEELHLQIDLNSKLEKQKQMNIEEIKLLKDYTYGID